MTQDLAIKESVLSNVKGTHPLTCTGVFLAALSAIAPNWNPPQSPCAIEGINKFTINNALHGNENKQTTTHNNMG